MLRQSILLLFAFFVGSYLYAQSFNGTYTLVNNTFSAKMQLSSSNQINYTGTMQGTLGQMQVNGVLSNGILSGNIQSQQGNSFFSFSPNMNGNNYVMAVMNYNMYGQPIPATATYYYFEKQKVNQHSVVSTSGRAVYFNGSKVDDAVIAQLENYYKVKAQDGRYWYDKVSGMWGVEGEKTYGVMLPNLPLGGPLKANASNGKTGVFINGRNLPQEDLNLLQTVTGYLPLGRYWIDAQGNAGKEGGPAMVNLRQMVNNQNNGNNGNGSTFYRNSYTGVGSGSSGGTFYVIGEDFSYIH